MWRALKSRLSWPRAALFTTALVIGLGIITVIHAEGLSYFSSRPEACANCHIMKPQLDAWQAGSHHAVATCVDCHLPTDFASKYFAKARNGYHHSVGFTTGNFSEPIRIKPKNAELLEANCRRCHEDTVEHIGAGDLPAIPCVHCHSQVGHASPAGVGGPLQPAEFE